MIHSATAKTSLDDDDEMILDDSADSFFLKKITWANIKATLKTYLETYFNTLYVNLTTNQIIDGIKTVNALKLGGALDANGKTINKASVRGIDDAAPSTGTTHTFDYSNGDAQKITCPAGGTLTLAFDNMPTGQVSAMIISLVDGGNCTITYPANSIFANRIAPALTVSGTDKLLALHNKDNVMEFYLIGRNIGTVA